MSPLPRCHLVITCSLQAYWRATVPPVKAINPIGGCLSRPPGAPVVTSMGPMSRPDPHSSPSLRSAGLAGSKAGTPLGSGHGSQHGGSQPPPGQLSGVMTSIMLCVLPGSVHGAESVHGSGGAKSQYGGSVQGSQHSQGQGYTRQLSYHGSREQLSGHHHHGDLGSGHHHDPGEYRQPQHRHRQPETIYDEERDRG